MKYRFFLCALGIIFVFSLTPCLYGQTQSVSLSPDTFNFGDHDIGTRYSTTFTIHNQTKSKVKLVMTTSNSDYFLEKDACPEQLEPDGSCKVVVSFSPMGKENRPGSFDVRFSSVTDDQSSGVSSASLKGKGYLPDLSIAPSLIHFPSQQVKTNSTSEILTLTNTNNSTDNNPDKTKPIAITMITASGDFIVQSETCSQPLQPGASCMVAVRFNPSRKGLVQGTLRIASSSLRSPQMVSLSGKGVGRWNILEIRDKTRATALVVLIAVLYWLGMVFVRWNRVARPTRELLFAQISSLQVQLDVLGMTPAGSGSSPVLQIKGLLTTATGLFAKGNWVTRLLNYLFWSRGEELAGWGYVHEAEIQMSPLLSDETVTARLESAEQSLRVETDTPSQSLAERIKQATSGTPPADIKRRQALLAEALDSIYDHGDSGFADLVSWQNKTAWLVGCGLLLIIALSGALNHSVFFLLGATGGLLSRLSRSLERKDVPTDYGASWTTLFLSPVAGALGGWTGILLATLAVKIGVLGSVFAVDWTDPYGPVTMSVALLLGFSERAFDSILTKLEDKVAGQGSSNQGAQEAGLKILSGPNLIEGTVSQSYRLELKASGGSGALNWSKKDGSLPDGLTLNSSGVISGTPTKQGTFNFTLEVADKMSKQSQSFTIKVN